MTIETKYDIGQEVHIAQLVYNGKKVSSVVVPGKVAEIIYTELGVTYVMEHGVMFVESNCFPTLADAQAECDRRNAEGK
jgi:hypothetical protein